MVVDRQAALDILENDVELLDEIIVMYCSETPGLFRQLQEAATAGQVAEATRHAHSLKSTSLSVGALQLHELARQAESVARAGDLQVLRDMLPSLESMLTQVLAELTVS